MSADTAPVEVVYSAADFRSLYGACRRCRRMLVLLVLAPALAIGGMDLIGGTSLLADLPFLVGLVVAGLLLAGATYLLVPLWQVNRRKKSGWSVPMAFALTNDAVTMVHPKQSSQWPWTAIHEVVAKPDRLFLFISPGYAIIIPRRAFASDGEFESFVGACHRAWEARHRL